MPVKARTRQRNLGFRRGDAAGATGGMPLVAHGLKDAADQVIPDTSGLWWRGSKARDGSNGVGGILSIQIDVETEQRLPIVVARRGGLGGPEFGEGRANLTCGQRVPGPVRKPIRPPAQLLCSLTDQCGPVGDPGARRTEYRWRSSPW